MAIPNYDSIGDANAAVNCKAFADAGAHVALQAAQSHGAHAARMNILSESILGAMSVNLIESTPVKAAAIQKVMTGRDSTMVAEALALSEMLVKVAQSTKPTT